MEIEKARELKREAEKEIRDILVKFAEATGLHVEGVRFQMTTVSTFDRHKVSCTSLTIDVEFDG